MGQFGDKFRKAREKKGISLDDVSNVTKISARMLQAIEEEHFDQLPGGVFNKGFIRAYARHVGLNDEVAVNEYLACLRQAQIDAQAVWEPSASGKDKRPQVAAHQIAANQAVASKVSHRVGKSQVGQTETAERTEELPDLQLPRIEHVQSARRQFGQRRNPLPWRPVVIALLLVAAVGVLWQRRMRRARAEVAGISTAPSASPSVPTSVPQASTSQPTQSAAAQAHATPVAKPSVASNQRSESAAAKPATSPAHTADQTSDQAEDSARTGNQDQAEDSAPAPDAASAVPVSKTPARFRLVIHADENSWISVTADGQSVSHETLIAPADASFRGNREIVARIGNAAGVSFVWNGQEFQPQGAEAEVKTFVFDENGMHEVSSGQAPTPAH